MTTYLHWVAAEMKTGITIADLPGIEASWPLRRTISNFDTATVSLNLDDNTPSNWERAVKEGASWLFCLRYNEDLVYPDVLWGGYITTATRDSTVDSIEMSVSSAEGYLDRVMVGDVTFTAGTNLTDIVTALLANIEIPLIIRPQYSSGFGPTLSEDLVLQNTDNASILSRLQQVFAQLGGEFTIDWIFNDVAQALFTFGERLNGADIDDERTTFEVPGSAMSLREVRDYGSSKAGNHLVTYSTPIEDVTPYAAEVIYPDPDRPRFDFRYSPGPNLTVAQLAQYSGKSLPIVGPGARPIALVVSTADDKNRRYMSDWHLGFDIDYVVHPYDADGRPIRPWPNGLNGTGRVIAVEIGQDTITPILADSALYTSDPGVGGDGT